MRVRLRLGAETHVVDLARTGDGGFRVAFDGVTLMAAADGSRVRLEADGRSVTALVVRDGGRLWVAAGGEVAAIEEAPDEETSGALAHAALEVVSPIPGRVLKVLVAEGDLVEAGQVVVTVEAMKMENALRAEGAGRVAAVLVSAGDRVEPGQRLLALAPAALAPTALP